MIKILSVPAPVGGLSHQLPLFRLNEKYISKKYTNNFLLPLKKHKPLKNIGLNIIPLDFSIDNSNHRNQYIHDKILHLQEECIKLYNPDLIIEDSCFTSVYMAENNSIPRISIQRTGFFRSIPFDKRKKHHMFSGERGFSLRKVRDLSHILNAKKNGYHIKKYRINKSIFIQQG